MSAEKSLHTLFVEQRLDDPEQATELFSRLTSDARIARQFDVLAMAARELEGAEDLARMSQMEQDFGELCFMHALDAQLEQEARDAHVSEQLDKTTAQKLQREAEERGRSFHELASESDELISEQSDKKVIPVDFSHRRLTRQIVAIAAVMLATLGVGVLLRPADPVQPELIDEFQPRGDRDAVLVQGPQPTLEVFCMTRGADGEVKVQGKREAAFGVVACPRHGEVQFAYTNPDASWRYAALFGISEQGQVLWYGPSPALPGPRRVQLTSEPSTLGDSIKLEVNHIEGTVKAYAIFSSLPIDHVMLTNVIKRHSAKRLYAHPPEARDLPEGAALVALSFDVIEVPQ